MGSLQFKEEFCRSVWEIKCLILSETAPRKTKKLNNALSTSGQGMQDGEAKASIQRPFPTHPLEVRILEKGSIQHSIDITQH